MADKPQEKPPAFPWYARDFLACAKVARMTLEEKGAYAVLLSFSWHEEGIPDDPRALARMLGCSAAKARKLMAGVLGECWSPCEENPHKLFNRRQEKERKKQRAYKAQKSDSGKKGAQVRWHSHKKEDGKRIANDGSALASASAFAFAEEEPPPTPPGGSVPRIKISRLGRFLKRLPGAHRADVVLIGQLEQWISCRAAAGKPLTPQAIAIHANVLKDLSPADAVASIERSMEHGWTTVYNNNGNQRPSGPQSKKRPSGSPHREQRIEQEYPESQALPGHGPQADSEPTQ